ncbi:MAG: AAA family ATPase [Tissierellales bacterium]
MNTCVETAIDKLNNISKELNDIFVEREKVIENSIRALITGQAVLLIGPPGTAKSALTNALCNRIENGRYFSWLLNRTSDPAEILGPFSIKEMENDKFMRVTKGKLPEAEIAFLDEVFKCNEPTLNILLPIYK